MLISTDYAWALRKTVHFETLLNRPRSIFTRARQWYTPAVAKKKINPSDKLTASQIEIVGQFKDYSHENLKLTFEQVVRREFGPKLFSSSPNGRKFEKECRAIFDKEREA